MRFGIIGFGKIARKFVSSITYSNGNEVVAIASKSLSEDDPYLLAHPSVKVYKDYDAMLASNDIDAVYVAIPHKYHYLLHGNKILRPCAISFAICLHI